MSLQSRLTALAQAVGADIKALNSALRSVPATLSTNAVADSERIAWRRTSDGALVAEIDGITTTGANRRGHLKLRGLPDGAGEKGQVDLEVVGTNPSAYVRLFAQHQPYISTRKRHITVEMTSDTGVDMSKALLRSDGSSDFATPIPLVTDLPVGTIADGREVYYQVTPGVIWHLRYNAGSIDAYKWEWVGGNHLSKILNEPNGGFTTTTTGEQANYNDLAGTTIGQGPRVVLPQLYGEFEIEFGYAAGWNDNQAYAMMSVMLGPSGDARNALAEMQRRRIENYSGVAGSPQNGSNILYEEMGPGEQVYCRYAQAGGGTARWRGQRYLRVRPTKVRSPLA